MLSLAPANLATQAPYVKQVDSKQNLLMSSVHCYITVNRKLLMENSIVWNTSHWACGVCVIQSKGECPRQYWNCVSDEDTRPVTVSKVLMQVKVIKSYKQIPNCFDILL